MQRLPQNKMATRPIGPLLITMGLPIMLSMMIQALYNVVDSIFIAQISEEALTAVSLAFPIQMLMISVGVGTSIGVNSLLSRRLGAHHYKEASSVAVHGLFLAIVSWVIFALFGAILTPYFFQLFTDSTPIIAMGQSYLLICTIFSIGIFTQLICERIMQGTGDTIHPMITQGTGAIINIILDPIFIFGYFGVPKMGVAGAAIATILGQWSAMGLSLFFMLRKTPELQFKFKGFRPKKRVIKEIYQVGLPSMIMQSIGSVMTISMNTILISFTATAVAVFGVYFKLQSFIFLPVFGLAAAMISIVAFNYGARDKERIIKTIKNAIGIVFLVMMVGLAIFQFFPRFLLELFNASPEMMEIGMKALRIISLAFPLAGIAIVLSSSFQALGKGFYSLFVSIIRQLVVLLPSAYLLSILSGLDAVWFAFLISEIVCLIVSLWLYARLYRRNIQTLDLHPETVIPPQSIENN